MPTPYKRAVGSLYTIVLHPPTHSRLAAGFTVFFQQNPLEFYDLNVTLHPCASSKDFLDLIPFVALCLMFLFPHT